jgi:hypothetical protein
MPLLILARFVPCFCIDCRIRRALAAERYSNVRGVFYRRDEPLDPLTVSYREPIILLS